MTTSDRYIFEGVTYFLGFSTRRWRVSPSTDSKKHAIGNFVEDKVVIRELNKLKAVDEL